MWVSANILRNNNIAILVYRCYFKHGSKTPIFGINGMTLSQVSFSLLKDFWYNVLPSPLMPFVLMAFLFVRGGIQLVLPMTVLLSSFVCYFWDLPVHRHESQQHGDRWGKHTRMCIEGASPKQRHISIWGAAFTSVVHSYHTICSSRYAEGTWCV